MPLAGYAVAALRVALAPSRVPLVLAGVLGLVLIWRRPRPFLAGERGINGPEKHPMGGVR